MRLNGVQFLPLLLALLVNDLSQAVDTPERLVSGEAPPRTEVHPIFPERLAFRRKSILRWEFKRADLLVRRCCFIPDYASILCWVMFWGSTQLYLRGEWSAGKTERGQSK